MKTFNIILYLRHRTTLDDWFNRFAVLAFITASFYGYSGSTRLSLRETGTVTIARTKREENDESLEDNCMTDQDQPEADTVYTPLGPIIHERYMVTKQGKLTGFSDLKAWYESTPHHYLTTAN